MAGDSEKLLLSMDQVRAATGIKSRTTIYALMGKGQFPKPCSVGVRMLLWRKADIDDWAAQLSIRSSERQFGTNRWQPRKGQQLELRL